MTSTASSKTLLAANEHSTERLQLAPFVLVARFVSGIDGGRIYTGNALLINQKRGQLPVYSLALATLGKVLVYDPLLAREVVLEARAPQTVPVILAKR